MPPSTRNRTSRAPVATATSTPAPSHPAAVASSSRSAPQQLTHIPTNEIVVDQRLSFDLVRILVTTNISHIIWRRNVFGRNYKWSSSTTIDPADPTTLTYDKFVAEAEANKRNAGSTGLPRVDWERTEGLEGFWILSRGQHGAADKILDWLEKGVKDALEKECLSKLELCFHRADSNPPSDENLAESYTMVFDYGDEGGITKIRAQDNAHRENILVLRKNARNVLDHFKGELNTFIEFEDPLPAHVRITMNMAFNDKCDDTYQPPGFIPSDKPNKRLNDLGKAAGDLSMTTEYHSVSIHLPARTVNLVNSQQSSHQTNNIVKKNIETTFDLPQNNSRLISHDSPKSANGTGALVGSANDSAKSISQGSARAVNRINTQGGGTQPEVMAMLEKMGVSRMPNADTQDTMIIQGSSTGSLEGTSVAPLTGRHYLNQLRRYKDFLYKRIEKAPERNQIAFIDEPVFGSEVKCECGVATDGENLMKCIACGHFQHMQCYGYYEPKAAKVDSVCYTCLLEDKPMALSQMQTRCIQRRLLYYLREEGEKSLEQIARNLDRDTDATRDILGQVKDFVRATQGTTRNNSSRGVTSSKYAFVGSKKKLLEAYFNPDLHIENYLEVSHVSSKEKLASAPRFEVESIQLSPKPMHRKGSVDGSTTQGTPSTVQARTPSTTASQSAFTGVTSSRGRKRGNLAALENDSTKRFKYSSNRSPIDNNYRY